MLYDSGKPYENNSECFTFTFSNDIIRTPVNRDSVVNIATSYGLDDRGIGVRVPVVSKIVSSPNRLDQL
jgi:glutamine synthetase